MRKYDEYKDSGVEWIGEVPSHWEVVKIKQVCKNEKYAIKTGPFGTQLKGQELQPEGDVVVYNQRNVIDNSFDNVQFYVTKEKARSLSSFYTKPGDILVTSRGTIGRAAILDRKYTMGILHPCLIAIRLNENKCLQKWLMTYINETNCFKTDITLSSNATTIDVVYTETLKNIAIPIPPLSEQRNITSYLDRKCREIDKVISAQQKRIALLQELKQSVITHAVTKGLDPNVEMKDSGVEWIGEMPRHWEVCRLKHISNLFGRIGFRGYNQTDLVAEGEGAITLSPSNMQNGKMNFDKCSFLSWNKYYESPEIMIQNGDILFVKTGSTYGKTSFVNCLPMEATINPQIVVFKNIKGNSRYLYYLLTNDIIQKQVALSVGGSTIPTLSQESILNYIIPLAPISEQHAIATYLDKKCASIDSSISKAQHQVALLQEYKQSLITEVVTGKRKVC